MSACIPTGTSILFFSTCGTAKDLPDWLPPTDISTSNSKTMTHHKILSLLLWFTIWVFSNLHQISVELYGSSKASKLIKKFIVCYQVQMRTKVLFVYRNEIFTDATHLSKADWCGAASCQLQIPIHRYNLKAGETSFRFIGSTPLTFKIFCLNSLDSPCMGSIASRSWCHKANLGFLNGLQDPEALNTKYCWFPSTWFSSLFTPDVCQKMAWKLYGKSTISSY